MLADVTRVAFALDFKERRGIVMDVQNNKKSGKVSASRSRKDPQGHFQVPARSKCIDQNFKNCVRKTRN